MHPLKSRWLSGIFVFAPSLAVVLFVFRRGGLYGLATDAESIIAIGGLLYGLVRLGRRWRGVKPPEHKPRRPRE
jgi:hypothetical protein